MFYVAVYFATVPEPIRDGSVIFKSQTIGYYIVSQRWLPATQLSRAKAYGRTIGARALCFAWCDNGWEFEKSFKIPLQTIEE